LRKIKDGMYLTVVPRQMLSYKEEFKAFREAKELEMVR
jgi:hypothetical protein